MLPASTAIPPAILPPAPSQRLEAFTDAAFAFALTLLVIGSGKPPESLDELVAAMKAIPAFVASATLLIVFWRGHVNWSRRYGLEDTSAVILTSVLLLTVMVYVYPLRLIASIFFAWITRGFLPSPMASISRHELPVVFILYGIGFVAMCACIALLYRHSQRRAAELRLSPFDVYEARSFELAHWLLAGSGALSILIALFPAPWSSFAGFAYMTLPMAMPLFASRRHRRGVELFGDAERR